MFLINYVKYLFDLRENILKEKIALAFSGGADSTYAAIKLKEMGYEVVAFNFPIGRKVNENVFETAKKLGIRLEIIDIRMVFDNIIKEYFYKSYLNGITPNPCVRCNKYIKFGILYNIVKTKYKIDFFSTGHYAKIYKDDQNNFFIQKAKDKTKDQSYFLWQLSKKILPNIIFPLGDIEKSQVKNILNDLGFSDIASKEESYDICFVNENSYKDYIKKYGINQDDESGYFIDEEGIILGRHDGIYKYTVGQRKGLRLAFGKRMYVRKIDPTKKEVIIGERPLIKSLLAKNINLFSSEEYLSNIRGLTAKIRYKSKEEKATVFIFNENGIKKIKAEFQNPIEASSIGQSLVIYKDEIIIAGGIIEDYYLLK